MYPPAHRRIAPALLASVLALLALLIAPADSSRATDPEAPMGAPPHWLPNEQWVWQHWLPYDEKRLYGLLHIGRPGLWRQLRDDTRTVAQLGKRRGWRAGPLAGALVAPRRGSVPPAKFHQLRSRALRTLTQGHLAQHIFFHSLHQSVIPDRAAEIFGVESTSEFQRMRRAELSPLQIGHLNGRSHSEVEGAAAAALKERVRTGVRGGDISSSQAGVLLSRQLRQLPRWLEQTRYNGPPPLSRNPKAVAEARDYANNSTLSADGRHVVFEAYESSVPVAKTNGEISVRMRDLGAAHSSLVSHVEKSSRGSPRSAYNPSVSADGRYVAFESSPGNLNFAKRYGGISVIVRDVVGGTTIRVDPLSDADARRSPRSSYNPSISADGHYVAFESSRQVQHSGGLSYSLGVLVHDLRSGYTKMLFMGGPADGREASQPAISGDGRYVAFTATARGMGGGPSHVVVRDLERGKSVLASRADGPSGASADGESYEPTISFDGRYVAFTSTAQNLSGDAAGAQSRVFVRDMRIGRTRLASMPGGTGGPPSKAFASQPAISSDGRFVAFSTVLPGGGGAIGRQSQVFLRDLDAGTVSLVSREEGKDGAPSRGFSSDPSVSREGRYVTFTSDAPNLSDLKVDRARGIFVRDSVEDRTSLVSKGFTVRTSSTRKVLVVAALVVFLAALALIARRVALRRRRPAVAPAA